MGGVEQEWKVVYEIHILAAVQGQGKFERGRGGIYVA